MIEALPPPPPDATRWPDAHLTHLLRAAIGHGEHAASSWQRVLDARHSSADAWTRAEARLLPLVWWHLRHVPGVTGLGTLPLIYQTTWASNHETLAAAAAVIAELHTAGIETLVFRGAGLVVATYPKVGLRPIGDVDLLVRPADAAHARRVLSDAGFAPKVIYQGNALSCVHSLNFERPRLSIDLHWRALKECQGVDDDTELWAHARPVLLAGVPTRVPAPEDHLILVCAHGLRWTASRSVHWLADAAMLVNAGGDQSVDWPRFLAMARARRLMLPMRRALEFLSSTLDVPVPEDVRRTLVATPSTRRERLEHAVLMRPPSVLRGLIRQWCEHSRLHPEQPWPRRLAGFPEWLRSAWGISEAAGVPIAALRKAAARKP